MNSVAEIEIVGGKIALVDADDAPRVSQYRWYSNYSGKNEYAVHLSQNTKIISMHRFILGLPRTGHRMVVDHINNNGLDNRRANLRVCTQAQNLLNRDRRQNTKSNYRGAFAVPGAKIPKWHSTIKLNGKTVSLGTFTCEIAAATAYDLALLRAHGEFARLNFPEKRDQYRALIALDPKPCRREICGFCSCPACMGDAP